MVLFGDIRAAQNVRCNGDYNVALAIGGARSSEEATEYRYQPDDRHSTDALGLYVLAYAGNKGRLAVFYARDRAHCALAEDRSKRIGIVDRRRFDLHLHLHIVFVDIRRHVDVQTDVFILNLRKRATSKTAAYKLIVQIVRLIVGAVPRCVVDKPGREERSSLHRHSLSDTHRVLLVVDNVNLSRSEQLRFSFILEKAERTGRKAQRYSKRSGQGSRETSVQHQVLQADAAQRRLLCRVLRSIRDIELVTNLQQIGSGDFINVN